MSVHWLFAQYKNIIADFMLFHYLWYIIVTLFFSYLNLTI